MDAGGDSDVGEVPFCRIPWKIEDNNLTARANSTNPFDVNIINNVISVLSQY
jgi:hypothetical protein